MLPTVFLPFMMEVVRVAMNEQKKTYVQHNSGVGENLPKSEYIVCDPPEEWRDVTHRYEFAAPRPVYDWKNYAANR